MQHKARLKRLEKVSSKTKGITMDWGAVAARALESRQLITRTLLDIANGKPVPAFRHPKGNPAEMAAAKTRILLSLNLKSQ